MTTDQVKEWRKAVAELHAEQRRNRGRRSTDPYARALPVSIKQPVPRSMPSESEGIEIRAVRRGQIGHSR